MRIGDSPPATAPDDAGAAQELHALLIETFDEAPIFTKLALRSALENRTPWERLPVNVRELFELVAEGLGL